MDPLERHLEKPVTEMTATELVVYMRIYMREYHGIDMPTDDLVDRKTIEAFQRRYGREVAGRIVQWVMLHHKGRKDGRLVTTSVFSARMKWWTDMMYLELQDDDRKRATASVDDVQAEEGFTDLRSLR